MDCDYQRRIVRFDGKRTRSQDRPSYARRRNFRAAVEVGVLAVSRYAAVDPVLRGDGGSACASKRRSYDAAAFRR